MTCISTILYTVGLYYRAIMTREYDSSSSFLTKVPEQEMMEVRFFDKNVGLLPFLYHEDYYYIDGVKQPELTYE